MRGPIEGTIGHLVLQNLRRAFRAIKCAVPLKGQSGGGCGVCSRSFRAIKCAVPLKDGAALDSLTEVVAIPRYQMRGPIEGSLGLAQERKKPAFRAIKCAVPLKDDITGVVGRRIRAFRAIKCAVPLKGKVGLFVDELF